MKYYSYICFVNTSTVFSRCHHILYILTLPIVEIMPRKILILLYMSVMLCATVAAQPSYNTVSGVVRDAQTGKRLAQVSITSPDGHEATVTNADGFFTLKSSAPLTTIIVSSLGYNTQRVPVTADSQGLKIRLTPGTITLNELIVNAANPYEIVEVARSKIPQNYSKNNELMRCFYRETTQRGRRYIYVAEAVTDMYKSSYTRPATTDRVSIIKGRKLVSPKETDTLGAKIQGGPTLPVALDVVKIPEFLLSEEEILHYSLRMEVPTLIDDRPQVVIAFEPRYSVDHVLYYGRMYIDRQTLAFTRIEMSLDMHDLDRATEVMLLHKPAGVRFRPRELTTTISYRYDGHVSRMHYLHSDIRFHCDWRKRLFSSPYHVEAEMVVTDLVSEEAKPIPSRASFSGRDSFYDKVGFFNDPDFWGQYNIIEPSESLESAINKLKKQKY